MRAIDLSFREAFDIYKQAAEELKVGDVPEKHIELAALCARRCVNRFAELNGLETSDHEVPEEWCGDRPPDQQFRH
jgi:hypothetical protein